MDKEELWAKMRRRHEKNPAFSGLSYLVQHYAENGQVEGTGAYFSTSKLPKYFEPASKVWETLSEKPRLFKKLVDRLNALGFRRIAFVAAGSYSSVFLSGATEDGTHRVIKILRVENDKTEECEKPPLFLAAIYEEYIKSGNDKIKLSVSPKIKLADELSSDEALEITRILKSHTNDLNRGVDDWDYSNYGIYSFKKDGKDYTLPVFIDDGMYEEDRWPPITDEMRREWKPWYEMQDYIQSLKDQNRYPEERLKKLKKATGHARRKDGSALVNAIEEHGLFPDEIGNIAQEVTKSFEHGDSNFSQKLRTHIKDIDPSDYPAR